jgi:hypothetical protein
VERWASFCMDSTKSDVCIGRRVAGVEPVDGKG